jgi:hypothetical protein
MSLISREDYINNNRASTKTRIRECIAGADSYKQLQQFLKSEASLADVYEDDGARDTAAIIREVNIPLIQEALAKVRRG